MKLKEIRGLIHCDCQLLIGGQSYVIDPELEKCEADEFEVKLIRSRMRMINGYSSNTYLEIMLEVPVQPTPDEFPNPAN